MGKRSNFKRNPRDFYPTPYEAVRPLKLHLEKGATFTEPCAGDGALIEHLERYGDMYCRFCYDIAPQNKRISKADAMGMLFCGSDYIITNPPWNRKILHPMIDHFRKLAPTWLLFDADWSHTKQSAPYMPYCSKIVSVGRIRWIPDSKNTGKDNCCWYLFLDHKCKTEFIGR